MLWLHGSCPSVRPVQAPSSQMKKRRQNQIGVNVHQGRCSRCANFQLKRSNVKRTAA